MAKQKAPIAFVEKFFNDKADKWMKIAVEGEAKIKNNPHESFTTNKWEWRKKTGYMDKAEMFQGYAKNAKDHVSDTDVLAAWAKETPMTDKVKQPWEMTKEEFSKLNFGRSSTEYDLQGNKTAEGEVKDLVSAWSMRKWKEQGSPKGRLGMDYLAYMDKYHVDNAERRMVVEQALSEGKPVPPEVLKDYPELQKETKMHPESQLPDDVRNITPDDVKTGDVISFRGDKSVSSIGGKVLKANPKTLVIETTYMDKPMTLTVKRVDLRGEGRAMIETKSSESTTSEKSDKSAQKEKDTEFLEARLRDNSVTAYSTVHFTESQNKLLKSWVKSGKVIKGEEPMWSGPGSRYRYYLAMDESPEAAKSEVYYETYEERKKTLSEMIKHADIDLGAFMDGWYATVGDAIKDGKVIPQDVLDSYNVVKRARQIGGGDFTVADYEKAKQSLGGTELQAIEDSRSLLSRTSDERQSNSLTIDPDDPRTSIWAKDPGRMDVTGIDTPKKSVTKPKKKKTSHRRKSDSPGTSLGGMK